MALVKIIRQMKIRAMPKICKWGPAASASSGCMGSMSRSMGVDSTESPTPAGRARMAMSRKAEEMMRSASAWSFRASAAAAKGIRLMVTG